MKKSLTISPPMSFFTAESYYAHVKSLHKVGSSLWSKTVPRLKFNFTGDSEGDKVIISIDGEKQLTNKELDLLAQEYSKPYDFFVKLFVQRKFKITDAETKEELLCQTKKATSTKKTKSRNEC